MATSDATVYSDGARKEESGPVGWGCEVIVGNSERHERSGVLDSSSVLLAELQAAVVGIGVALEHRATEITVYTDATSLIDLVNGKSTKPLSDPAIAERVALLAEYSKQAKISWAWVRAHKWYRGYGSNGNHRADRLARQAIGLAPCSFG